MKSNEIVFDPDAAPYCLVYLDGKGKETELHAISAEKLEGGSEKIMFPYENGVLIKLLSESGRLIYLKLFTHKGQLIAQMVDGTTSSEQGSDFFKYNVY